MVDYNKSTGNSGTMRIRDTGTTVEFWISSGNSTTYAYDMPWRYHVNGTTSSWREFRYEAGAGFERLGSWNVTTTQTVTFYLGDTGTSGLGGPTTFSVTINRAKAPSPPSACALTVLNSTTIRATFSDGASNGAAIDARQIGYGTSSTTVQYTTSSDRSTDIGLLTPGTTWYFWARTHNSVGWSAWGPRSSATTWRVPDAPQRPTISEIKQTSVKVTFVGNSAGGTPILEYQIGYGTSEAAPQTYITANTGTAVITNLQPGVRYYFWARGRNSVGWGPLSPSNYTTTRAGAYVKVGNSWLRAVPYVKVNGVWRLAEPWARSAGEWKETGN